MAVLYIAEYSTLGLGAAGQIAQDPPLVEQTVAIGAAAQSAPFNVATRFLRLHCDVVCSVLVGANPISTVSATNKRMAANQTEYVAIPANASYRVGVITNT